MSEFEIYLKEFSLVDSKGNTKTLKLKPLSGKFLPKLYALMSKFNVSGKDEFDISAFDEETVSNLHLICLETMKASYPNEKEADLDLFVSQNFVKLLEPVISVNVGTDSK